MSSKRLTGSGGHNRVGSCLRAFLQRSSHSLCKSVQIGIAHLDAVCHTPLRSKSLRGCLGSTKEAQREQE